jgi:hypothetical protein
MSKIAAMGSFSHRHNLDIVALQASSRPGGNYRWLTTWVESGRVGSHGGRVRFVISERVVFRERPDLLRDGLEASWIEVSKRSTSLLIGSVYVPPRRDHSFQIFQEVWPLNVLKIDENRSVILD